MNMKKFIAFTGCTLLIGCQLPSQSLGPRMETTYPQVVQSPRRTTVGTRGTSQRFYPFTKDGIIYTQNADNGSLYRYNEPARIWELVANEVGS